MHIRVNTKLIFSMVFLLMTLTNEAPLFAGSATLSWTQPNKNADNTALKDLAGYIVSYGISSGEYTQRMDVGNVTSYEVQDLNAGQTYYFAVTAYDVHGNESDYSNEGSKYIPDTTPVTYYCDSDGDGSAGSTPDGVCTGIGCEPSGCATVAGDDCNDNDSAINPGESDSNCNGIDDNCDGTTDNFYVSSISSCGKGVCSSLGEINCIDGKEVDTCTPGVPDQPVETLLNDGLDNDCDGLVDEGKSATVDISRAVMAEDFSEGIPAFWTADNSWNTENSCGRTVEQPFEGNFAIVDSACTETGVDSLVTPPVDTTGCDTAALSFSSQYNWYSGSTEVDISTDGGASWSNLLYSDRSDGYPAPVWKEIDLGSTAEPGNTLINFKYMNDSTEGFWALDNIWVTCKTSALDFSTHVNIPSSPESLLISNTGAGDLTIDSIELNGTDATEFELDSLACLHQSLFSGESCMIDIIFTPVSEGTKDATLLITTNDSSSQTFSITLRGTGSSADPPVPSIKANGQKSSLNIKQGSDVAVDVDLDPKSYTGENADWWILMQYKNRWYYFDANSKKWRRGDRLYQQAPLKSMGPLDILKSSHLRKGSYTFHFGVDTDMNGMQDFNKYYSDYVTVNIE